MFNLFRTKFYPERDLALEPPTLLSRFNVVSSANDCHSADLPILYSERGWQQYTPSAIPLTTEPAALAGAPLRKKLRGWAGEWGQCPCIPHRLLSGFLPS
jgi:hypothetical protein